MPGTLPVHRGFIMVDGRDVHYRAVGDGPPALFIHSSPTNSSFVLGDMHAQADRFRCIAFDTPGFGLSDPLPLAAMTVADLAEATAAAMAALGLPPLPVYGTHSGAAIALELGYRYPERVTGLVLDGVPIFTREEVAGFADARYFAPLVPDVLGGHYAATWTRFRDQSLWFPWYSRRPETLNEYDLGDPASLHRWASMFFAAAAHYGPAYRACVTYCDDALVAAAGLTVPAVYTATPTDMLRPHLTRLPPLKPTQRIVEIDGVAQKQALTGESFAWFGSGAPVADPPVALASTDRLRRQFVMDDDRPQLLRFHGDRSRPVVLLLHDVPGSARMAEARIAERAQDRFVVAPDIPGSGESAPLAADAPLAAYAAALWRLCDALGIDAAEIEGHGFGASLALEMAAAAPGRCRRLAIDGLLLPDPAERADLRAQYAPPIAIERDGAHWYRLWLRLRDELVYWPWFDTRRAALRRAPTVFDAIALHERTVEAMKQHAGYQHYLHAALAQDAAVRLADCAVPVDRIADPLSAIGAAYGERLAALLVARDGSGRAGE